MNYYQKQRIIILGISMVMGFCTNVFAYEFNDDDGAFSVSLPSVPDKRSVTQPAPGGQKTYYRMFVVVQAGFRIGITHIRTTNNSTQLVTQDLMKSRLKLLRDGVLSEANYTLLSERSLSIQSFPALDLWLDMDSEERSVRQRIVVVNNQVYIIVGMYPKSKTTPPEIQTAFNTFRLF